MDGGARSHGPPWRAAPDQPRPDAVHPRYRTTPPRPSC